MKDIEGIPEGWDIKRIGTPEVGDYFINTYGDPVEQLIKGGKVHTIIEKEHKEPELVWMLSTRRKPVAAVNEEDRAVKKLNGTSILEDVTYDRILTIDGDGEEWMYLGHWNDGVSEDA